MLRIYSEDHPESVGDEDKSLAEYVEHAPWIDESYPSATCWVVFLCDGESLTPWSVEADDIEAAIAAAKADDRDWRYRDGEEAPEDWANDTDVMRVYRYARLGVLCAEDRQWAASAAGLRDRETFR